jgi:putrescine aminotransferase
MTAAARRSTKEYQQLDREHFLHPFTDFKALAEKGTRIITRAEGVYVFDNDGNKILDGMAGLWCVAVGYGRKELADAAYEQLKVLPFYNSFFQCTHPKAVELATRLSEIAPGNMKHVFFTNSGSEANDTVIRTVRRYWELLGEPQKSVIISRKNAYHGSTLGGASLCGMKWIHDVGAQPLPGIVHIDQPYWFGEGRHMDPQEFGVAVARKLEEQILLTGLDRVAAFIAEPVQGAGGVVVPPESYWPEIKRICQKYGILLVVDEVICGFGRLGQWFGSHHFKLEPDLMPIAKGLTSGYIPMGGVLVGHRVAKVLYERGGEYAHGFTYSAHPVACAVALENIRILDEEKIIERVRNDISPYLQKRWRELADHPLVGEARGLGLVGALELVKKKEPLTLFDERGKVGTLCRDLCVENGLVMRAVGDTMIISPPLVITRAEIDELIEKARKSLDLTHKAAKAAGYL